MIVEANLYGTHEGPLRGLPPTGRSFQMRFCAVFVFEEDRLVCERVYFDQNTILRQLGIAHDPSSVTGRVATAFNHPLTDRPRHHPPGPAPVEPETRDSDDGRPGARSRRVRVAGITSDSRDSRRSLSTRPPVCSSGQ